MSVFDCEQGDGKTEMTESTRSTNSVEIGLSSPWEIEVDDNVHGLDVDTTSEEIGADQVPGHTAAEVVEDSVSMSL